IQLSMLAPTVTVEAVQPLVIVQLWVAGEPSTLPAASIARTRNECAPTARPLSARGDVQAAYAALSSEHSNVEPTSVAVNANDAVVAFVLAGGVVPIVVFGAAVSIVHVYVSGEPSGLPNGAIARTRNVCVPALSPVRLRGDVHRANGALSSEHWNVEPTSFEVNANVAEVSSVGFGGWLVMSVSGGVASRTFHVREAGVSSTLPAASTARTRSVWSPYVRPEICSGEEQLSNAALSSEHSNSAS